MNNKKFTAVAAGVLAVVWLVLTGFVWFTPAKDVSVSERRPLAQMPQFTLESFKDGTFKNEFDEYLVDQFPYRDQFRQLKGILYTFLLNQKTDANGLTYVDGHLTQVGAGFNEEQFMKRMEKLNQVYNWYLKKADANVYVSVIPDKNYYLAQNNPNLPVMDYEAIFSQVQEQMAWGQYIDMTGVLNQDCFYTTDTHWRQETILPVAQLLCQAMGGQGPNAADFEAEKIDLPFYGVWYGKAGLPVAADDLYVLRNPMFDDAKILVEMKPGAIYDEAQLSSSDPYNIFLSGAKKGIVTIENPNANSDKRLIVFRDSFGSSMAPLLVQDYASITLIDLRVMSAMNLRNVDFKNADVLFMLSALVLNNTAEAFL